MVENCVRRLSQSIDGKSRLAVIRDACMEVRGPTMFGELIIAVVYVPVLMLEGTEGKMFRPMALTVLFALFGSFILSMTLMPALSSLSLPKDPPRHRPLADSHAEKGLSPVGETLRRLTGGHRDNCDLRVRYQYPSRAQAGS